MKPKAKSLLKTLATAGLLAGGLLLSTAVPAPEVIFITLEKPVDLIHKTDNVKLKGDMDGLVEGKSYILRCQVFENGGTDYSAPLFQYFAVEW